MSVKSERLKKFESELDDLEQWKKLGLVPKKDLKKHDEEIQIIKEKINAEIERLEFMKENGDIEEYVAPKRSAQRQAYAEPQTLPEMDIGNQETMEDVGFEVEETFATETVQEDDSEGSKEQITVLEEIEDNPFSDKNRWKRGILEDPDVDNW